MRLTTLLLLGTLGPACQRAEPAPRADARTAAAPVASVQPTALEPWEPVDAGFNGCEGA